MILMPWTEIPCPTCAGDGWRKVRLADGRELNSPDACFTCSGIRRMFQSPAGALSRYPIDMFNGYGLHGC